MNFRTELCIPPAGQKINHNDIILLLGSCFSQNIGERLQKYKFKCISNPFGTVFNPVSISKLIQYACDKKTFGTDSLQNAQGVWVHPDFHSSFGDIEKDKVLQDINKTILTVHNLLVESTFLFITLGTVTAYKQISDQTIVSNCHKIHPSAFSKISIKTEEGYNALSEAIDFLIDLNPDIHIVFTVSPVRHIKDGIIENSRSKATLIKIVEMLEENYKQITYFPAYEWMMDDLRDYRFYGSDLVHPNEQAIDYIWDKFRNHYFSAETSALTDVISKILQSCSHKPFNFSSEPHQKFIRELILQIQQIQKLHPQLNFDKELDMLNGPG